MFARTSADPAKRLLPPNYPAELERDITLEGIELHVRPVIPADAAALRRAVDEADPETMYLRFFAPKPSLDFEHLTNLDYRRRLALTAWHRRVPVAVARYEPVGDSDVAEVAFAVKREYRNLGVASSLLSMLATAAKERGYRELSAVFLPENDGAARVLAKAGFAEPEEVDGVLETRLAL